MTYSELQAHIQALTKQAEELRAAEIQTVIEELRSKMAEYGLTAEDLMKTKGKRRSKGSTVAPKYRDPKTGATWSGRGRTPAWLANKNRERFLIK